VDHGRFAECSGEGEEVKAVGVMENGYWILDTLWRVKITALLNQVGELGVAGVLVIWLICGRIMGHMCVGD